MFLLTLKKKLTQSNFFKNVAKLMAGTVIAQALTVLSSPILTRLYTPSDFGIFALFTGIVSVISIIATGRYDLAVVVAKNRNQAFHVLTLAVLFIFVTGLLTLGLSSILIEQLRFFFGSDNVIGFLILIPITVLFTSGYMLLTYWANREKDYSIIARTKVLQNFATLMVTIAIGYYSAGQFGMIIGFVIGAFVAAFNLIYKYFTHFRALKNSLSRTKLNYVLRQYRKFPLYSMPSSFLDTFTTQAPVFFITLFFGSTLAGHFGFTFRIISLPIAIVGASIAQVFFQKLSEEFRNRGNCQQLILRTWSSLFLIGILPCLILLFVGPQLFSLVFGPEWLEAGTIARYLAVMQLFILVSSPTSTALIVFGEQKLALIFGLASAIYRPLTLYFGYISNDFYLGLILFAFCEVVQVILYNIVILRYSSRYQREWAQ